MSLKRKTHPFAARIKQMMKADDDVGKIAQATPVLLGRAVELFLQRLTEGMVGIATARNAKTLSPAHLKAYVNSDEVMDFLKQTVASAPDMPEEAAEGKPKPRRKRKAEADEDGASPKATKPRARKSKAKAKKEEAGEDVKEEEEGAAAEGTLPEDMHNGAGEGALKAEEVAAGGSAQQPEGPATAAQEEEAGAGLLGESHTMASLPPTGPSEMPEEDDYDDL